MRWSLLIFFISVFQVQAITGFSQKSAISLNFKNASIATILSKIEDESNFYFMCNRKLVDLDRTISIQIDNEPIETVLTELFKGTNVKCIITGKQIVLTPGKDDFQEDKESRSPHTVSGKVTDSSGSPLPGVSVIVKGTTAGTITDLDGKYSFSDVPDDATLVFSFVGMKSQEVATAGINMVNVTMAEEAIGLDEVVAVGYGTVKKRDLTGSVSSVKSDELNSYPSGSLIQSLAGRASGVQVLQNDGSPGASVSIRIRGTNSIQGDNEPLYVIDGFPSEATLLNPADIENIEILKDASATAIYGSRGANGVVLITTKQGKIGKTKVELESSFCTQRIINKIKLMDGKEYATYNYYLRKIAAGLQPLMTLSEIEKMDQGTDWQNALFNDAPIQNYSLNVSGGNKGTQFLISGSVFNQKGIIQSSDFKRYSLMANIKHDISKKLSIKYGAIISRQIKNVNGNSENSGDFDVIKMALYLNPMLKAFNNDGSINHNTETDYTFLSSDGYSPFDYILNSRNSYLRNKIQSNVELSFKPISDLSLRLAGNIYNQNYRNDYWRNNDFKGLATSSYVSITTAETLTLHFEGTATYTKKINNIHSIQSLLGFTSEDYNYKSLNASGQGFISNILETYDLGAASTVGTPSSSYVKSTLLSYLGRINYSYKDKYLLTATMRADGSSKFSEGSKWGYFPSAAVAWRIKQENWLKDNPVISDLKLRVGWGETGNQAINAYATQVLLNSNVVVFDDSYQVSFSPSTTYPGDLKWETTLQTNIGADFSIFNNRYHLTADYYHKTTKNLLNSVALPSSMGWNKTIQNIGSIQNKGLELSIDAIIIDKRIKWDMSGNIAFNRNKVLKLYEGQDITGTIFDLINVKDYVNIIREGHPLGEFYGYVEDGYDDSGNIKYKDISKDGIINSSDKVVIGNPNPDFVYGFSTNLSYRNFTLNIFLQGSYGNDIYNLSSIRNTTYTGYNFLKEVLYNYWTPENMNAKYPGLNSSYMVKLSDRFVEDGSYLRVKNVQLSYDFPMKKKGVQWINNLQIYLSGQNLWTFTKYSWWDPDVNSKGSGISINQGIDYNTYPSYKSITVGLKARF